MKEYRLQIAFDIKDENNKSVLNKNNFNTVSRSIGRKPSDEQLNKMHLEALTLFLSQLQEIPQFRNLFYRKIQVVNKTDKENNNDSEWIETPVNYQGYSSLIHSKYDKYLNPFLDKHLPINQDSLSKTRLAIRKIQYYWRCFCELIRL